MSESSQETESLARLIAFWHGQKMVGPGSLTLAARHGYGSWGHSAEDYAKNHWREYDAAADAIFERIRAAYELGKLHGSPAFSNAQTTPDDEAKIP